MPVFCGGPSVQKCPSNVQLVTCLKSMCTTLKYNFADSGKMCSGVVILGLVLALVLAQERQDNRPEHLIHVRFADQVSLYNH